MEHKTLSLALMALLISAVASSAQAPAAQRPADTGVIEGTAKGADSGDPIKGVAISLSGGPADPAAFRDLLAFFATNGIILAAPANGQADDRFFQALADAAAARNISMNFPPLQAALARFQAANDSRFTAISDDTGHFVVRDLPPGQYRVQAQAAGFFSPPSPAPQPAITVVAGRTSLADVSLLAGFAVSGRVTDESGKPVPDFTVQAFSVRYQAGFPVLQPEVSKTTDDRGEYRLFWLREGEYLIAASPRGDGPELGPVPISAVPAPPQVGPRPIDVPVPLIHVPSAQRTYFPGTGDIALAQSVVVQRGAQLSGLDIQLRKTPTFKISGEIRSHIPVPADNTRPVNGNLVLSTRDSSVPEDIQLAGQQLATIPMSPSGTDYATPFTIDGVMPGAYDLKAFMNSFSPIGGFTFTSRPVDVVNQDLSGVVLDIFPRVALSGVVTVDGHAPGADTIRVAFQVEGSDAKRPTYQGFPTNGSLAGSQDGIFTKAAMPTGRFHVLAGTGLPPNLYVENVLYGGQSVFDSGFDIGREEIKGLQVMVRSGAGVIEGTVRDSSNNPVPGAAVVLVPPSARRKNPELYRTATSDPAGRFKIQGIAPGEYDLFAWQTISDGAYYNARFISRYEDRARHVRVGQSSTGLQDLVAIPAFGK